MQSTTPHIDETQHTCKTQHGCKSSSTSNVTCVRRVCYRIPVLRQGKHAITNWVFTFRLLQIKGDDEGLKLKLPVEPQFVPAAAADPPDPDSVLQDSGSAPAAGSSPAPAPPQPTVNHLETSGRTTDEGKKKTLWMSRKREMEEKQVTGIFIQTGCS